MDKFSYLQKISIGGGIIKCESVQRNYLVSFLSENFDCGGHAIAIVTRGKRKKEYGFGTSKSEMNISQSYNVNVFKSKANHND